MINLITNIKNKIKKEIKKTLSDHGVHLDKDHLKIKRI